VSTETEPKATQASLSSFAVGQTSDFSLCENRKLRPSNRASTHPSSRAARRRGGDGAAYFVVEVLNSTNTQKILFLFFIRVSAKFLKFLETFSKSF
jgi:hypothetical protein